MLEPEKLLHELLLWICKLGQKAFATRVHVPKVQLPVQLAEASNVFPCCCSASRANAKMRRVEREEMAKLDSFTKCFDFARDVGQGCSCSQATERVTNKVQDHFTATSCEEPALAATVVCSHSL